jgi:hypothetical protein
VASQAGDAAAWGRRVPAHAAPRYRALQPIAQLVPSLQRLADMPGSRRAVIAVAALTVACGAPDREHRDRDESSSSAGGAGGGATSSTTGVGGGPPPVDLCEGLVTDAAPRPMTPLAKPAVGVAVTDPEFGTTLRRITDVGGTGAIKPMYSTVQCWNADESLLVLYEVGHGHRLYDGHTYQYLRDLPLAPPDLEQLYWHHADPRILYLIEGNALIRYDVLADAKETVRTLPCSGQVRANSHGFFSFDSNTLALKCDPSAQAFIHRIDSGQSTGMADSPDEPPSLAPSGELAYWGGWVLDADLVGVRQLDLANAYDHASLGRYRDGRDAYDVVAFDEGPLGSPVGSLVSFDITTGAARVLVGPDTGYPYPPSGTHLSAVATANPGWVFVSVVGDPSGQGVLDSEIFVADTDPSGGGAACRVAHHRSFGSDGPQGYWAEPHVSASPSGTRALFGSDWGGGATVDAYVVELPSYSPP